MKCTILVVDDEIDILEAVSELLAAYGFHSVTARSVHEAQNMLESQKVDLVISDVVMPEAPGTALRRFMQADVRFRGVPIVFMTAFAPVSEALSGPILGKPFDGDDLLKLVNNVLRATSPAACIPVQPQVARGYLN